MAQAAFNADWLLSIAMISPEGPANLATNRLRSPFPQPTSRTRDPLAMPKLSKKRGLSEFAGFIAAAESVCNIITFYSERASSASGALLNVKAIYDTASQSSTLPDDRFVL
ncbi:hypothetical protein ATO67_20230 [Agrobacterium bohemicum]|uniref:Uncharacterized protein n=1 Tax=Agrobacterium bohemicum TaxID=2052828 RepID=A0A135P7D4_9HYPH|nr:hypothetical protein ATO67_20230 [Agrobacterium bohemicum]